VRPYDIEKYGEELGPSSPEVSKKAANLRKFLTYLYKEEIVTTALAPHLRLKKSAKSGSISRGPKQPDPVELTQAGIDALKAEHESLVAQRPAIREAIRVAMLDKDFRENSPLDAAKDRQGHVEARIREIEAMLKRAVVVVEGSDSGGRVRVGTTVTVTRLADEQVIKYSIVGPTEANAADGKISSVSPVGKAFLDCQVGQTVEVETPRGSQSFRIDEIGA
jgi:transcription elongation factor GreA